MTGKTHLAAGAALGLGVCLILQPAPASAAGIAVSAVVSSILPDIDTASSKIGRRIAPLAWILRIFFGHRRLFHSLLFWAAASTLLRICGADPTIVTGFALGAGSHLLLDMLNPAGIELLWPLPIRLSLAKFRCGGIVDHLLAVLFTGLAILLGLRLLHLL